MERPPPMTAPFEALLRPLTIKRLTIRNRIMSTSHAPSYGSEGKPKERYQLYHEEKAKGGIGLTMFGGSSSVAVDSPAAPWNQISVADDSIIPFFREFADRIHRPRRGADDPAHPYGPPHPLGHRELAADRLRLAPARAGAAAPSPRRWRISTSRASSPTYAAAARRCKEGGLDGCELSAAHGHLIDQFWSPSVNQRTDEYGGSLENRMRFGIEVLEAMRAEAGDDYPRRHPHVRRRADRRRADATRTASPSPAPMRERGLVDFVNLIGGQARDHLGPRDHPAQHVVPGRALPGAGERHQARGRTCRCSTPSASPTCTPPTARSPRAMSTWSP